MNRGEPFQSVAGEAIDPLIIDARAQPPLEPNHNKDKGRLRGTIAAAVGALVLTVGSFLSPNAQPAHADHEHQTEDPTINVVSLCSSEDKAGIQIVLINASEGHELEYFIYTGISNQPPATGTLRPSGMGGLSSFTNSNTMTGGEYSVDLEWVGHPNGTFAGDLEYRGITCPSEELIPGESWTFGQDGGIGGIDPEEPTECSEEHGPAPFIDRNEIPSSHRPGVDCAAGEGITTGFPDGRFRPTLTVPRDQMATFVARAIEAAGGELPVSGNQTFSDVSPASVHADNINRVAAAGIVMGGPEGLPATSYGPNLQVRRDQMASFLIRAMEYVSGEKLGKDIEVFIDVPRSNVHSENVAAATELGLALGFADGTYRPASDVRRDQMATFASRLLQQLKETLEEEAPVEEPEPEIGDAPIPPEEEEPIEEPEPDPEEDPIEEPTPDPEEEDAENGDEEEEDGDDENDEEGEEPPAEEESDPYVTPTTWTDGKRVAATDTNEEFAPFTEINRNTVAVVDDNGEVHFVERTKPSDQKTRRFSAIRG